MIVDCANGRLMPPVQLTSYAHLKRIAKSDKIPVQTILINLIQVPGTNLNTVLPDYLQGYEDVFDIRKTDKLPKYRSEFAFPIDIIEGESVPQSFLQHCPP